MDKGVCVFDIDRTLTCEQECLTSQLQAMNNSIKLCQEHGFRIAINTARPMQDDILHGIQSDIKNQFTSDPNSVVLSRPFNSSMSVPTHKLMNMQHIANIFDVPYEKAILIDDVKETCNIVESNGMKAIHVEDANGITATEYGKLKNMLENM